MHIMIKSLAIPFILAVEALAAALTHDHTITVNTTSGRLSGVQTDGGMRHLRFLLSLVPKVTR